MNQKHSFGHSMQDVKRLDFGSGTTEGLVSDPDGEYVRYKDMVAIVEKYKKDAERYRWLCEYRQWPEAVEAAIDIGGKSVIDAAIDNAVIETTERK